jgi:hypothetical protein
VCPLPRELHAFFGKPLLGERVFENGFLIFTAFPEKMPNT